MHVVAVTALDQALVNAMTIRTGKIGPGRGMTAIAKFRLRLGQQVLLGLGVMRTVAVHTTHIVARMGRNRVVALRLRFPVTLQATLARLRSRKLAKTNDLRFVPAPGDVLRAGSVARLAAMPVFLHGLEVRRAFELLLVHILVARHTGFGSGILSRTLPFADAALSEAAARAPSAAHSTTIPIPSRFVIASTPAFHSASVELRRGRRTHASAYSAKNSPGCVYFGMEGSNETSKRMDAAKSADDGGRDPLKKMLSSADCCEDRFLAPPLLMK